MSKDLKKLSIVLVVIGLLLVLIGAIMMITNGAFEYKEMLVGGTWGTYRDVYQSVPFGLVGLGFVSYLSGKAIKDYTTKEK